MPEARWEQFRQPPLFSLCSFLPCLLLCLLPWIGCLFPSLAALSLSVVVGHFSQGQQFTCLALLNLLLLQNCSLAHCPLQCFCLHPTCSSSFRFPPTAAHSPFGSCSAPLRALQAPYRNHGYQPGIARDLLWRYALYTPPALCRLLTLILIDATIRNSAEQQLTQAADTNFVSLRAWPRLHIPASTSPFPLTHLFSCSHST